MVIRLRNKESYKGETEGALVIEKGPHDGYWIKDGDRVILWVYSKELAETRLNELQKELEKVQ